MRWRTRTVPIASIMTAALVVAGIAAAGPLPAGAASPAPAAPVQDGNPFLRAAGYVNPDWSARASTAAANAGQLSPRMATAAHQPTAVWLDSIASIGGGHGRRGLRGHLDAALQQQATLDVPVVVTLVLYNLPNRDCARSVGGELTVGDSEWPAGGGLSTYRTRYIDPIAAILADPAYASLRVAVVVEPNALWSMLLYNRAPDRCAEAARAGVYLDAVPYALTRLHEIPNVYAYLDIAQSNLLGWPDNLTRGVQLFAEVAARTPAGTASVDGFAVNVADYDPVSELFLDPQKRISGKRILESRFADWNPHLEEQSYINAMYTALVAKGFAATTGMLVDTSRNGWGGPGRPTAASTSTDLETYVRESKVDRRDFRFTWCNQAGAGLGERPRPNPTLHVHAYAWIKPPGESDGHYDGEPRESVEAQCNPYTDFPPMYGAGRPTNALPGAPPRGEWFDAAFTELVSNAYPPLPSSPRPPLG